MQMAMEKSQLQSWEKVLKTLGSATAEEVKRMMDEINTDGDGFISFEEFTEFA
ncbi:polcalcin Nic t 1-like [Dorcoceras hygrometricum]|uniref:Polcalcin Nic t 1-like n=1 Tax=Dorcoceras hygrometricum TaxID=472368 RepID=A0A2Z7B7Y8_9LAMI|nr:polcalcin Nic t 1-like [Dorcoceras hygrometricum]